MDTRLKNIETEKKAERDRADGRRPVTPARRSLRRALCCVLLITVLFLLLFPVFEKQSDRAYEDPLTGEPFISLLYRSNFIQYKYLRDRADQKSWSLADLFVQPELIGTYDLDESMASLTRSFDVPADAVPDSVSLQNYLRTAREDSLSEITASRDAVSELIRYLDYYAVDRRTGTAIGNSGLIAGYFDMADREGDPDVLLGSYSWFVRFSYDGSGNLQHCSVGCGSDPDAFLKKVEALGHDLSYADFDENGRSYVSFYNAGAKEQYYYEFSLTGPADMDIVYAVSAEQYDDIFTVSGLYPFTANGSYYFIPDVRTARHDSYLHGGVVDVYLCFLALSFCAGGFCVFFCNRRRKGSYVYQELRICRLPLEVQLTAAVILLALTRTAVDQICDYQHGWFLQTLNDHLLAPLHLSWLRFFLLAGLLFFCFLTAFTIGTVVTQMRPLKPWLKERSLICRYWSRCVSWGRDFWREISSFDIGTDASRITRRLVLLNFVLLFFISLFWFWGVIPLALYSVVLYFVAKKYIRDVQVKYEALLKATGAIAGGDFDVALSEDFGVFESYKNELRSIQKDFKRAVDEEVKSQRMRSELITNVSHDLKTPLTAIITYINLLKEPGLTEEQRQEYLNTLDKKAVRLKVLIEDLFEVSKASTNNITLHYERVDVGNLLRQGWLEYEDRFLQNDLQVKFILPEQKVYLMLDPQKTFRIIENLYINVIKYALPATRVYVTLKDLETEAEIEIKNISKTELLVAPEELTERFVRGDGSRNTEGSGLGLAIAKSFTELQHGSFRILLDGDLFKVVLRFRRTAQTPPEA